jgi:acyl-[acyl-carrier-protein]-phospholipid O-acyltransferase/long-chain-fatty-acid--[acyl-carrier-protein] ligase
MTDIGKLLTSRRLGPLCLTQSCGAFNDNLTKNAMVVLALFQMGEGGAGLSALAGALFIFPYAVLSATAGQLADRFDKARLIRIVKLAEVVLMVLSAWAFMAGSIYGMLAVLFGLGAQAAMFGPLKYGILPDHLADTEIVAGNGLIEASTFLAILAGTIAGGGLILLATGPLWVALAGAAVSLIGLASALAVPSAPATERSVRIGWNLIRESIAVTRQAAANRTIWLCILGLSWLWVIGSVLLTEFPVIARDELQAGGEVMTLLLTVFAVGTGAGSIICARLLNDEVSARHVPLAAFGMAVFCWDFASAVSAARALGSAAAVFGSFSGWRMMADLLLLSACGGLYSVPLYAIMQETAEPAFRARAIAANNIVNALLMIVGAGAVACMAALGLNAPAVLHVTAVVAALVAIWIVGVLPQTVFRAMFQLYFRLFHGVKVEGLEHLAKTGDRTMFVINHQSYLDGCLVAAFLPGDLVFAIDTEQFRRFWFLKYVIDVFPVDPNNPMSIRSMVHAIQAGRRLAIFPEGRLTLTGGLMKIYDGPGMIANRADADVVAVRVDGLQFHKTSRMAGRLPLRWFPGVSLRVSPPVKLTVPAEITGRNRRLALTAALQNVMTDAAFQPERLTRSLFGALLEARRLYDRGLPIVADLAPVGAGMAMVELRYNKLILASVVLGQALARTTEADRPVGVMLPNAIGTAATFFALQSIGRVPAMLNFTAGADGILSACRAAKVQTILTSRRAVEKGKMDRLVATLGQHLRIVYLEDVRATIGLRDKLRGMIAARNADKLPGALVTAETPAVILFTSGSEGAPKGVVHSHRSLLANCAQLRAVTDFHPGDRVLNALPMFHAFGLIATLLPLMNGVRTFLYPSPLHYKLVPEMAYWDQSTIMFGTDTFLTGYARKGNAMDFQSLRYIFAGAERVRPETRATYMNFFKKPIFEGYGVTETAPVLALSTWINARDGSVGRLLPGIEHRLEPVPGIGTGARLLVRGPNVMLGYLHDSNPGTIDPPPGGWYDTGDVVTIDAEGFVRIAGRVKRFAKIGGEMVSLAAAEALAGTVWPDELHAVVAIHDPRKGERLLLVTTKLGAEARALLSAGRGRGIPEIQIPRDIVVVHKLPLLGTGKIDYPAVRKLIDSMPQAAAAE